MQHADVQAAEALEAVARAVSEWTVDQLYGEDASMEARYGAEGRRLWRHEIQSRVAHLVEAIACDRAVLFTTHATWSRAAFMARDLGEGDVARSLRALGAVIRDNLPAEIWHRARGVIEASITQAPATPEMPASVLDGMGEEGTLARLYLLQLLQRDREAAERMVQDLLDGRMPLGAIYERVIAPAMNEIGRMWHLQEASIADEHYCTSATQSILARLRGQCSRKPANGLAVITCSAGGDMHELGIRMVSDLFEMDGWNVECLGANMPSNEVAASAGPQPHRGPVDVVAVSAGTPLALRSVAHLIDTLRQSPQGDHVAVLVGGQPFHLADDLWQVVGADGMARSASTAPAVAADLVRRRTASATRR